MITDIILLSIAFIALVIASISDLKTREVPDWLSYAVIFIAFGIRGIYSLATFNWMYLVYGLVGFGIFVAIAYAMFYAGQWGGGDAKMIMGLGVLIGVPLSLKQMPLLAVFFINVLVAGAVYGLCWIIGLSIKHRKKIAKEFREQLSKNKVLRYVVGIAFLILLVLIVVSATDAVIKMWLAVIVALFYALFYLFMIVKAVEKVSMYVHVSPEKLTEGDWIAKDYYDGKKRICGPKDLGIEKKQIKKLIAMKRKGRIKKVRIKMGIPFVPSFLIAYVATMFLGAWWMFLI
jgi:Flp pilus assembly protein protease CpaA